MPYAECSLCSTRYYQRIDGTRPHRCERPKKSYRGPRKERRLIQCVWINCGQTIPAIVHEPTATRSYTMYRLEAFHGAGLVRYPICKRHQELVRSTFGFDAGRNGIKAVVHATGNPELRRFIKAPLVRLMIFDRAHECCQQCLNPLQFQKAWHADHIVPAYLGGALTLDNVQVLCPNCHAEKTRLEQSHASRTYWENKA